MDFKKVLFLFLFPFSLFSLPGYHEPWGKDADLLLVKEPVVPPPPSSLILALAKKVIWFHQHIISPVDGPRSHFKPSSSNYMLKAIEKHGFIKGYTMGCSRLLRENGDPWVYRTASFGNELWKIDPPP